MGIRHLVVINESNEPIGMITRKELRTDFKQDLKTKVSSYGAKQADALEVMTAAGWK